MSKYSFTKCFFEKRTKNVTKFIRSVFNKPVKISIDNFDYLTKLTAQKTIDPTTNTYIILRNNHKTSIIVTKIEYRQADFALNSKIIAYFNTSEELFEELSDPNEGSLALHYDIIDDIQVMN